MSKKIDINKILSTGSAKQRVVLLFNHFNIKETIDKGVNIDNHKLPLTDKEAQELFNSFKSAKDIKVYNDYRALNIQIINNAKWLLQLVKSFETEYWKYQALFLANKYILEGDESTLKEIRYDAMEDLLIYSYSAALEYYTALKIYIKETGYRDKIVIGNIEYLYKELTGGWTFPVLIGDKETKQNLSNVEPDEDEVKKLLKVEFNLEYETEE
jgi:hypothetical protein